MASGQQGGQQGGQQQQGSQQQGSQSGQGQQQQTVYTLTALFDQSWSPQRIESFKQALEQQAQAVTGGNEVQFAISQMPLNTRQ